MSIQLGIYKFGGYHMKRIALFGFLGFSAGGGVAIAATMLADSMERPDFLCTNFGPSLMPVTVPQDAPPLLIMTRADAIQK